VLPWATRLPQTLSVSVTGAPATAEVVRGAVERALGTQLTAVHDAWISYAVPRPDHLPSTESTVISVQVRVGSADSLSVTGTARVTCGTWGLKLG